MTRIATIQGLQVDLDKVQNPKLRRVVEGRGFMFSYSDHNEYTEHKPYHEYHDKPKYKDYDDYNDVHIDFPEK
jgi:hypothetical protein